MGKIYIETYGCAVNKGDSEIMKGLLKEAGFSLAKPEEAEIGIINTCVVKESTEKRMIHRIKTLEEIFGNKLIVAGCMPLTEYGKLKKLTSASFLGAKSVNRIVEVVRSVKMGKRIEILEGNGIKLCKPRVRENPVIGIVQISEGCLSKCSFCITKYARGNLISYPAEKIVSEIKAAKKSGCKEFWITSQDNGCYGFDSGTNLPELLKRVLKEVKGKYFIRTGMMNPQHVKKILGGLLDVYKDERVFKFLHIPVQSGSDSVLRRMKRGYKVKEFAQIVKRFRKEFPEITVWTDMIVGFPGETEREFSKSLELLKEIKSDFTNISRFSSMRGTEASEMKQLPSEIKKERSRKMFELTNKISLEQNEKWLNWSGKILLDEYNKAKRTWIGRNFAYKPVVIKGKHSRGEFVNVKIIKAEKTHLFGKVVKK